MGKEVIKSTKPKNVKPEQDSHTGEGGELHQTVSGEHVALTTNQGVTM